MKTVTTIKIKVIPRSSKNELIRSDNSPIKIKLTAPPAGGKANKALQQFLSKKLGIPKTDVEIVSGQKARGKLIKICGLSAEEVDRRLKGESRDLRKDVTLEKI